MSTAPVLPAVAASWTRGRLVAAGLVLMISSAAWLLSPPQRWTQRLPAGWEWQAEMIGVNTRPDPATGELPPFDPPNVYRRRQRFVSEAAGSRAVTVEDDLTTRDAATGAVTWQYVLRASVDPRTGRHLDPAHPDDHFVFPPGVEKRSYRLRFGYVEGIPLAFERVEDVEGLDAYVFAYRGAAEYTESYAGTKEFPGVPVTPGQQIRCVDDQFVLRMWVEPVTGETLKIEESCYSGGAIFDEATGRRVAWVDRWGGATQGDDVLHRVDSVRTLRARRVWSLRYGPATVLVAGVALVLFGLMRRPRPVAAAIDASAAA